MSYEFKGEVINVNTFSYYTVKEFVAATGKTDNIIRHQIRNHLLKTIKKGKLIMIQYEGDPKDFINIKKPARTTYKKGDKKGLLTFISRKDKIFTCVCDCGNTIEIRSKLFYGGNSKTLSCGCNKEELRAATLKKQKFKRTKSNSKDIINKDLIRICKRFGVLDLLDINESTFNGREFELKQKRFLFKDNGMKLTQFIYQKYGHKTLSFQEELATRRK